MGKIVEYPRKPFETALEIAEAVEKLGGKCSEEILGNKLGKSKGGSFTADIVSALKHGLVTKDKDTLRITDLFKDIKLSYTDEEKNANLVKAFLMPDTYREILERFNGKSLPIDVLDKMLTKEYTVNNNISQRVANNLIKGAEGLGLIINGKVQISKETIDDSKALSDEEHEKEKVKEQANRDLPNANTNSSNSMAQKLRDNIGTGGTHKEVVININIQLTVPETTNEEVYEKFFAAMKKNLLS